MRAKRERIARLHNAVIKRETGSGKRKARGGACFSFVRDAGFVVRSPD
jgi:hypothetical protein